MGGAGRGMLGLESRRVNGREHVSTGIKHASLHSFVERYENLRIFGLGL